MDADVRDLWDRACKAIDTAERLAGLDRDAAASRFYYAAFYAVTALFARERRYLRKHSAVEATVHRDLVNAGRWAPVCGADYSFLLRLRTTGDYGAGRHVTDEELATALQAARRILEAVRKDLPEDFPDPPMETGGAPDTANGT